MTQMKYSSLCAILFVTAIAITETSTQVVDFTETIAGGDANWRGPAPDGSDALIVL